MSCENIWLQNFALHQNGPRIDEAWRDAVAVNPDANSPSELNPLSGCGSLSLFAIP